MSELTATQRAYRANIWKLYAFHFLLWFQLWWSVWVLYLTDFRGFSLTQVAVLEAIFWMIAVFAEVPTGAIADRYGRKQSLVLGAAFTAVGVFVFSIATNYPVILLSYSLWGFGIAFLSGAEHAMLFESLKGMGREREYQQQAGRVEAVFSFAALAGGLAGAPIAAATNLSVPVMLSAAMAAPGVLVALSMREPDLPEGEMRLAYGKLLRESASTSIRLPAVGTMLVMSALVSALLFGPMTFMQPFLQEHNVEVAIVGVVQTPTLVASIAGALAAAWVASRIGVRGVFLVAPVLMAGGYVLLFAWDNVLAFSAFLWMSLVNSLLIPPASDYLNRRIPSSQRATILSLRQMLVSLGAAALLAGLGVTADAISLRAAFLVAGIFSAVVLPLSLFVWLRADAVEEPAGEAAAGTTTA